MNDNNNNTDKFDEFVSKLLAEFEKRGISEECPYCHKNDWLIMDWSSGGAKYIKPARQVRELGRPFIMLTCPNCGNIRLIDPDILGLAPEDDINQENKRL